MRSRKVPPKWLGESLESIYINNGNIFVHVFLKMNIANFIFKGYYLREKVRRRTKNIILWHAADFLTAPGLLL